MINCIDRKIEDYVWNKLYKKSLFNSIRFPINKVYEDIGTTYKLLYKSKKVCVLDCKLYAYLCNKESITYSKNIQSIYDRIEMSEERYKFLIKNLKEYKEIIEVNRIVMLLSTLMWVTHYNKRKVFYSKKLNKVFKIIKNTDKSIMKSKLVPKRYYIEYILININKELFRISNVIYHFFKTIIKQFENY